MNRSVGFYLFLELGLSLLWGCGGKCVSEVESVHIGDMSARTVYFEDYNIIEIPAESDSIRFYEHAIWLEVEPNFVLSDVGGFTSIAEACSPVEPQLDESVSGITITTLSDYNETMGEGQDVTLFFEAMTGDGPISLEDPLLNHYFRTDYYLILKSREPIEVDRYLQFRIEVQLDDGSSYSVKTDKIYTIAD